MVIPIIWLNFNEDAPNRGYWDQGLLEDLFAGRLWRTPGWPGFGHYDSIPPNCQGAVIVLPGRQNAALSAQVQAEIQSLEWVLLIVTGDEENEFPLEDITHPNIRKWCMDPNPNRNPGCSNYLGSGYPPGMREYLSSHPQQRELDWFFSGQVTHSRRVDCVDAIRNIPNGVLFESDGFTKGFDQEEYWSLMSKARVAPCPGGPVSPDSFRLFEALEAGCVPLADGFSGKVADGDPSFWTTVLGDKLPFPIVQDWNQAPSQIAQINDRWVDTSNKVGAWWMAYKRKLAFRLIVDIGELSGQDLTPTGGEGVTVIIPSSPVPSHPSTSMIEEVVASVRAQLPNSEIIISCDGIRPEQESRSAAYTDYIARLIHLCHRQWTNVLPVVFEEHLHQGVMARRVLPNVITSKILYVEHDAPIYGDIPWGPLCTAVDSGVANVIRLHHEASILEPHKHLMLTEAPLDVCGAPLLPTVQWSQRPHLANKTWYESMVCRYFGESSRTMIEDVMYGVLETHYREEGRDGWDPFRLFIYAPDGDMKRSWHLDGRAGEPKYSMKFDYDGTDDPKWAPFRGVIE